MPSDNGIKEELVRQVAEIRERLGKLEGKVDNMSSDISEIKKTLDGLNRFRWKAEGARALVSFLAGIVGAIVAILTFLRGG